MHTYHQATGVWTMADGRKFQGYSGQPQAKNDGARERERAVGPIPRGRWRIVGDPYDSKRVGPFALVVEPVGHDAFGRSAFRIHGDSIAHPGTASNGCIILSKPYRVAIAKAAAAGVREFEVA